MVWSQYQVVHRNFDTEQQLLALLAETQSQLEQLLTPRTVAVEEFQGDVLRFQSEFNCRFTPCASRHIAEGRQLAEEKFENIKTIITPVTTETTSIPMTTEATTTALTTEVTTTPVTTEASTTEGILEIFSYILTENVTF